MTRPLNARQQRFVQEYAVDHNATQAAIRAGYSEKSAYQQGYLLVNNPEIRSQLAAHEQSVAERLGITLEWLLDQLREKAVNAQSERDQLRAMELLGKHLAIFTEKVEHSGSMIQVQVNGVDLEELR
jgi:phage terminase small subunit